MVLAAESLDPDPGGVVDDPDRAKDHVPVTGVHVRVIGEDQDLDRNVLALKIVDESHRLVEEVALVADIDLVLDLAVLDLVDQDLNPKIAKKDLLVEEAVLGLGVNVQNRSLDDLDRNLSPDLQSPSILKNQRTKTKTEEAKINQIMAKRMTVTRLIKKRVKRNLAKKRNLTKNQNLKKKIEIHPKITKQRRKQNLKLEP